ncbi:DUF262 domain-containing protein [Pectobacterium brasiliense]|uniref:DUF262 domain-containing protein n=1 Tax=Pectobacterium TaxID=122277 RepID=UPI0015DE2014|nr:MULTISPECIES: DUF262 domain-containing protein [Pectobacterium]MBA0196099.1 DUF262 domain-containing protein [Pectobacterium brasiliense]MBA5238026.1 DUF262 domain-containing protein [Pectobacterium aroidearum]MBN3094467.1 DUF262 domain-containing protein [Pectobacterium brasiliense]MBN3139550.1 DUF262 domain-containing protein [Pectobacterium brasiliense]MBN3174545.1 DUF262 domain-containing protein [Pectobacterium brasiliense]
MEAKECKVQDILTENKKFIIPSYQRPYSWTVDNAEQLIDDIYKSSQSDEKEYFIGSMICISKGQNHYEVVDGQQRLTTLSIIVSELKKIIPIQGIKDDLQKRVLPIDVYSDETDEPRLIVRKKEYDLYKYYILQDLKDYKPEKPSDTDLVFISNSEVIKSYLTQLSIDELKVLAKYILQNVYIVFVQTDDFASSFRLFNVLNSRGLPLSNADLLKNALFESASAHNKKSEQIESAWSQIEDMVGVRRLDKFLTLHKLSEKRDRDRVLQKGFESFIENLQGQFGGDAIAMSLMLVNSAKNYTKILENDFEHSSIRRKIASLSNLGVDEWIPPLMAFMNRMARSDDFTIEDFSQFITSFEKVYMHGWLKKQIKSQREMVCYSTLVAINNDMPFESVINQINQHADNVGFTTALDDDLYEPRPNQVNLIKAILLRLDMEQQDESVIKTYTGRITIEHILPQALVNEYWIRRFSPQDHVYWLHKIGNLTLISGTKNSEAQHSDFIKKKSIYEKLNSKSSFDLTKDVCKSEEWSGAELEIRHENMKYQLKKLWLV